MRNLLKIVNIMLMFIQKKNNIVSTDNGSHSPTSIIWSILNENNYEEIHRINIDGKHLSSLIFNKLNNELFFINSSTLIETKIWNLEKKKIKIIKNRKGIIAQYLVWMNKKQNQNYVIQINDNYISIYNFFVNPMEYYEIEDKKIKDENPSGCILYNKNNTDILCIVNELKNIVFYDYFLAKLFLIFQFKINH